MQLLKKIAALLVALSGVLAVAGCSSETETGTGTESEGTSKIRFALDWTPNTNHTGLYVAMNKGYFEDAGLDVEVLPYSDSNPDVLVDAGKAEFGVSFHESAMKSIASGANVQSVLAVLQTWATEITVLAERDDIQSPKDLDGMTYGGFGADDSAVVSGVIQAAGGQGDIETVTLGTSAYEALYSGDVDFTIPFIAWEGIEAEDRGVELKSFAYHDYGFPDCYQVLILGNTDWLEANPEEVKAFISALQRGYEFAAENPDEAAEILQAENPDMFTDVDFLKRSQRMLAEEYMLDAEGKFGRQTEQQWNELGEFFVGNGLLKDTSGTALTEAPNWSDYFTNAYLAD